MKRFVGWKTGVCWPSGLQCVAGTGIGLLLAGCVERYEPEVPAAKQSYLVVDGFINSNDSSTIRLTHTVALSSKAAPTPETRARLYAESEQGPQYPFVETQPGVYRLPPRAFDPGQRYRLHFYTRTGREYASAYTDVKRTPPIDSLTWGIDGRGVTIKVNTHDATSNSRYYRWNYDETWEFTSAVESSVNYRNGRLYPRRPTDQIYQCWGHKQGSSILLGNTVGLRQDVMVGKTLFSRAQDSWELLRRYSVRVQQRAQTRDEYEYWEQMQKNTESIGSIYDALPTQLTGNVQCLTDPDEQVLGFVGVTSVTEKRLFIAGSEYPAGWLKGFDPYYNCSVYISIPKATWRYNLFPSIMIPISAIVDPNNMSDTIAVSTGSPECVDCTRRGSNRRPDYW